MSGSSAVPRAHAAIVTCMDARIDPVRVLGLEIGDAHVLRNAGATVSDDVLRSLVLSQRLLATRSVRIMAHTSCGLLGLDGAAVADDLARETGKPLSFELGGFSNLDDHVRQQVERVRRCPWLAHVDEVFGHVLDIETLAVRDVAVS